MKSTKTILAVAIVIAGFASLGCGSDVSGGVSIADAREECNLFEILATGQPASDAVIDVLFIEAEAARDDGLLQSVYIEIKINRCRENEIGASLDQCFVCLTSVAAAVWP